MDLINGHIRPGIVRWVDEKNPKIIKVSAPGLFSDQDPADKLPPVKLFSSPAANATTSVKVLDEVWVLNFDNNPTDLYWMRKDDSHDAAADAAALNDTKKDDIKPGKAAEVVMNKNDGGSQGSMYFSNESGVVVKKDDSYIQIGNNGDITMDINYPGRTVKITKEGIILGAGSSAAKPQPVALGDNLQDVINKLSEAIATIEGAAKKNPYTMQIALALAPITLSLQNISSSILSSNVKAS